MIRTIRDPEKPNTLEELDVVTEKGVEVQELGEEEYLIIIRFSPTVPHCSLATLIGEARVWGCHGSSRCDRVSVCRSVPPGEAAEVFALQTQGEAHQQVHPRCFVTASFFWSPQLEIYICEGTHSTEDDSECSQRVHGVAAAAAAADVVVDVCLQSTSRSTIRSEWPPPWRTPS